MPRTTTPDGVELHWEERGSGPPVILVPYWNFHPSVFEALIAELVPDHRVITYDERGCGQSDPVGPYDMETGATDLQTVLEAADDRPAVALGLVDAVNRAVRVAARRPELLDHVVGIGSAPVTRDAFADMDSLISSTPVVDAFMQLLGADYRGALRSMIEANNEQWTMDEIRERVNLQAEYCPQEAAEKRINSWSTDADSTAIAKELGDRMTILVGENIGGGWFPDAGMMIKVYRETFPDAVMDEIADGIVSAPELTAAYIREHTRLRTP